MGPDEKPNQSVRKVKANHGLGFNPLVLFHSQYLFQISLNLQDDSTKAAIINQIEKKNIQYMTLLFKVVQLFLSLVQILFSFVSNSLSCN